MALFKIGDKEYHLKEKFTLRDWEEVLKIDEMFNKISQTENGKVKASYEMEEIAELICMVCIDENGQRPNKEDVLNAPIETINLILPDFFLEYMKRQIGSMNQFQKLVEQATDVLKK